MFKALGKSVELLVRTIFLGAEKAAEKAMGVAELYIKGLALLAFISIVLPIPFLVWGISTGQRLVTSLTGLYWFICAALVFAVGTPLGIVLESVAGGPKGSYIRYQKFFVGIFTTGLYVSMLFSIIPIATNLANFPLLIIVLLILGMLGGWVFKRWLIILVASLVFVALLFTFMFPAPYESLIVKMDSVNRPVILDITYEDTQVKGFSFFRSDGKNIYWYTRTLDGKFELFNRKGYHPITNEKLLPLDGPAAKMLMEKLKSDYDEKARKKREQEEIARKDQAAIEAERKKYGVDLVTAEIAVKIIQKMQGQKQRNLAIMPFTQEDSGRVTALAMHIYSRLRAPILYSKKVTLIDESKIGEALANTPEIRPSALSSTELNKLRDVAGAHYLLRGSCQELGEMVEMSWFLTNLVSMEVYSASTEKILKDVSVSNLLHSYVDDSILFPKPIFTPPLPDPPKEEPPRQSENVSQQSSNPPVAEIPINPIPAFWPRVYDYNDVQTKLNAVDVGVRGTIYDRTNRPTGHILVELNRVIIQKESITFALTWTNYATSDARLQRSANKAIQPAFVQDRNGARYFCTAHEPTQLNLKRRIPATSQITFPNFISVASPDITVDLYIQLQGKPNPDKYAVLRSIRMY